MSFPRLASFLCCVALGLTFTSPAPAAVKFSLTFSLNSQQVWLLEGYWTYNSMITFGTPNCTTGSWRQIGPNETDTHIETNNPFSSCSSLDWGVTGAFDNYQFGYWQRYGGWSWQPHDPVFSGASLTCSVDTQPFADMITFQARVDGLNCTISNVGAAPSATFVSSAAPVRDENAVVLVQLHPGTQSATTTARAHHPQNQKRVESGRHLIVLLDAKGKTLGRERETIISGKPRAVHVRISKTLRQQVAKKGRVAVTALITRVDGKPGTGHKTKIWVMRDDASLDF